MKTFSKSTGDDWTLPAFQDKITDNVIITRQDSKPIYNYAWWQKNKGSDATGDELNSDFWGEGENEFTETGSTKGIKWAILDSTGFLGNIHPDFDLFGKLGDTTNFYSFHNIASIINYIDSTTNVTGIVDNFEVRLEYDGDGIDTASSTYMPNLVGKNLGAYLVEDKIFIKVKITNWGTGGANGGSFSYMRSTED